LNFSQELVNFDHMHTRVSKRKFQELEISSSLATRILPQGTGQRFPPAQVGLVRGEKCRRRFWKTWKEQGRNGQSGSLNKNTAFIYCQSRIPNAVGEK